MAVAVLDQCGVDAARVSRAAEIEALARAAGEADLDVAEREVGVGDAAKVSRDGVL